MKKKKTFVSFLMLTDVIVVHYTGEQYILIQSDISSHRSNAAAHGVTIQIMARHRYKNVIYICVCVCMWRICERVEDCTDIKHGNVQLAIVSSPHSSGQPTGIILGNLEQVACHGKIKLSCLPRVISGRGVVLSRFYYWRRHSPLVFFLSEVMSRPSIL